MASLLIVFVCATQRIVWQVGAAMDSLTVVRRDFDGSWSVPRPDERAESQGNVLSRKEHRQRKLTSDSVTVEVDAVGLVGMWKPRVEVWDDNTVAGASLHDHEPKREATSSIDRIL